MSMIPVSVIIPVYNVDLYLREALDSVINQTYEDLEIIVINDGSTDNSGKICNEYALKDSRIRVIHQKNKGISAARNTGLDAMSGELVVFLDPDDAYLPEYVKTLVETQIQNESDIVVCRYVSYKETGKLNISHRKALKPAMGHCSINRIEALQALVRREINSSVWNKIYRRELWNNVRFPEGHVYEDIATTHLVMDLSNKVTVIDDVLYMHRQRPGSIVRTSILTNLDDRMLACSLIEEFIVKNTPDVFSPDDLKQRSKVDLDGNISLYARCKNYKNESAAQLRDRLIQRGREIRPDTMRCRTKVAYFLLCHCPMMLTVSYPVCSMIRCLFRRIAGK